MLHRVVFAYLMLFVLMVNALGAASASSYSTNFNSSATKSYMVGIRSNKTSVNKCSGVLIAPKYVLSVNCLPNRKVVKGLILDQIGDTRYASIASRYNGGEEDGERIPIVQWRSHPKYGSKTGDYNYIIFILGSASSYQPVTVSNDVIGSNFVGASLPSMGWLNGSEANSTLAQPSLTTLTLEECVQKRGVGSTMLCLMPKQPEDACSLNVGSPLIKTQGGSDNLLALVNYNKACNETDTPVIFNYLLVAESWIKHIANV